MARKGLIIAGIAIFAGAAFLLLRGGSAPSLSTIAPRTNPGLRVEEPLLPTASARESVSTDSRNDEGIQTDPAPAIPLPSLADSDSLVREKLEAFGFPEAWIEQEHLLRRLAVFADNATRGELAHRQLDFAKPEGRFRVVTQDGRLYADPENAKRFDLYLDRLEAIDPAMLARLVRALGPLIDEAFEELGSATRGNEAFREAIDRILEVPVRTADLELIRPNVLYEYADPDIESLPPLDKQLLRLGPMNFARLKVYLHSLRVAL